MCSKTNKQTNNKQTKTRHTSECFGPSPAGLAQPTCRKSRVTVTQWYSLPFWILGLCHQLLVPSIACDIGWRSVKRKQKGSSQLWIFILTLPNPPSAEEDQPWWAVLEDFSAKVFSCFQKYEFLWVDLGLELKDRTHAKHVQSPEFHPSTRKEKLYKVSHRWVSMNRKLYLPLGFVLLPSQTRHWACRTGRPGTCSTSLQNISGPFSPQVALALMWALVARLRMAGNKPESQSPKAKSVKTSCVAHLIGRSKEDWKSTGWMKGPSTKIGHVSGKSLPDVKLWDRTHLWERPRTQEGIFWNKYVLYLSQCLDFLGTCDYGKIYRMNTLRCGHFTAGIFYLK
jgi:hypothetical protein